MPRRNPPAKWVLPTVVNPPARRCIMIEVPDDPAHIAAFRGALWALAAAYNWADDPAHTAKDVALVWRDLIDSHQEWGCMNWSDLVFRQDECGLYVSTDGGGTETLVYDGLLCLSSPDAQSVIEGFASALIDGMIADGKLPTGSQGLAPETEPAPGDCKTFHASIDGGGQWMCPVPVADGYTISISDPTGGWMDGNLSGWYCPDGSRYLLNTCDATGKHYAPATDPCVFDYHMAVIGRLVTDGDYFPLTAPYTVPAGKALQNFILQANDAPLSDNAGNVNLTVTVCNANWSHTFTGADLHTWIAATGAVWDTDHWRSTWFPPPSGTNICYIRHALPDLGTGVYKWIGHTTNIGIGAPAIIGKANPDGTGATIFDYENVMSHTIDITYHGGGSVFIADQNAPSAFNITSVTITGTGSDPF